MPSSSSCLCDDIGIWSIQGILQCQKISDFFIALAYFSIPLELFYFVSCSTIFPFRWILLQFGAFIVLCGLTHFVAVWTYEDHSFRVMLTLTVLKFFTALVSFATSITLLTLIPQVLRVMVREGLLRKKTTELNREVGKRKRQEEASWHVRMLTQEIRRSLDRHTILYTTLVELSKVLLLENCVVWMPSDSENLNLNLTHELKRGDGRAHQAFIPLDDPDVVQVIGNKDVRVLGPSSQLRRPGECGPAVAVRMPMLGVSNFRGTQESVNTPYAVLVLVLPAEGDQKWDPQELELVETVVDQVTVALSHAGVLEESLRIREKLMEQNLALERARREALMANSARCSFQKVMSRGMGTPTRSVAAVLSVLQQENLKPEQRILVESMVKLSLLLSTLVDDATSISNLEEGRVELKLSPFSIPSMVKEVACVSKLLCSCQDVSFDFEVSKEVPDYVIGDEKRILQLVLYMVGNVLDFGGCGNVFLSVFTEGGSQGGMDPHYLPWQQPVSEEFVQLRIEVRRSELKEFSSTFLMQRDGTDVGASNEELSFTICKKLAQIMNGTLSISSGAQGMERNVNLTIRLQFKQPGALTPPKYTRHSSAGSLLRRMNILLADGDGFNRSISRKLLESLGCHLSVVSSWRQCLETLRLRSNEIQLLLIDLDLLEENINEMSSRLRKLRSGSWLLIVALVSKADRETRDRCLQKGVHGVLCKPIILQEMEEELHKITLQSSNCDR